MTWEEGIDVVVGVVGKTSQGVEVVIEIEIEVEIGDGDGDGMVGMVDIELEMSEVPFRYSHLHYSNRHWAILAHANPPGTPIENGPEPEPGIEPVTVAVIGSDSTAEDGMESHEY